MLYIYQGCGNPAGPHHDTERPRHKSHRLPKRKWWPNYRSCRSWILWQSTVNILIMSNKAFHNIINKINKNTNMKALAILKVTKNISIFPVVETLWYKFSFWSKRERCERLLWVLFPWINICNYFHAHPRRQYLVSGFNLSTSWLALEHTSLSVCQSKTVKTPHLRPINQNTF